MSLPFFYLEISRRTPQGSDHGAYEILVRCANKGYGHRQDPVMVRVQNARSIDEGLREVRDLMPAGEILGPDEYIAEMARRSLQGNEANYDGKELEELANEWRERERAVR